MSPTRLTSSFLSYGEAAGKNVVSDPHFEGARPASPKPRPQVGLPNAAKAQPKQTIGKGTSRSFIDTVMDAGEQARKATGRIMLRHNGIPLAVGGLSGFITGGTLGGIGTSHWLHNSSAVTITGGVAEEALVVATGALLGAGAGFMTGAASSPPAVLALEQLGKSTADVVKLLRDKYYGRSAQDKICAEKGDLEKGQPSPVMNSPQEFLPAYSQEPLTIASCNMPAQLPVAVVRLTNNDFQNSSVLALNLPNVPHNPPSYESLPDVPRHNPALASAVLLPA